VQYKIGWRRLYQTLGVEPPSYGSALTTTLLADGAMLQTYFGEAPDKGAMRITADQYMVPGGAPAFVREEPHAGGRYFDVSFSWMQDVDEAESELLRVGDPEARERLVSLAASRSTRAKYYLDAIAGGVSLGVHRQMVLSRCSPTLSRTAARKQSSGWEACSTGS
jgi:hypothetical protein